MVTSPLGLVIVGLAVGEAAAKTVVKRTAVSPSTDVLVLKDGPMFVVGLGWVVVARRKESDEMARSCTARRNMAG